MANDLTHYSERIEGDKGNFDWTVRFDWSRGYVGINQSEGAALKDRILLSPKQVEELIKFVQKSRRSR